MALFLKCPQDSGAADHSRSVWMRGLMRMRSPDAARKLWHYRKIDLFLVSVEELHLLTLYGYKGRSRAERALWALQEAQLPFTMVRLDAISGETHSDEFLKMNPSGKVPVLLDGERAITESMAILHHIDRKSDLPLTPRTESERIVFDTRLYFLLTEVEPYLWVADQATFLPDRYSWPDDTANAARDVMEPSLLQVHSWLEDDAFIAGPTFSMADILAYHLITWASLYLPEVPAHVSAYLESLEKRPAFPDSMRNAGSPAETG